MAFSQTMHKDFSLNNRFQGFNWEIDFKNALHIPGGICVKFAGST